MVTENLEDKANKILSLKYANVSNLLIMSNLMAGFISGILEDELTTSTLNTYVGIQLGIAYFSAKSERLIKPKNNKSITPELAISTIYVGFGSGAYITSYAIGRYIRLFGQKFAEYNS